MINSSFKSSVKSRLKVDKSRLKVVSIDGVFFMPLKSINKNKINNFLIVFVLL